MIYAANDNKAMSEELRMKYCSLAVLLKPVNDLPDSSDEMFQGRAGCGALLLERKFNPVSSPVSNTRIYYELFFIITNHVCQQGSQPVLNLANISMQTQVCHELV